MHRIALSIVVGLAVAALTGCGKSKVDTEQPADQFKNDVQTKIQDLETRIDDAKGKKPKLAKAEADALESATEMAEEKIETLRQTSLPKLTELSGKELDQLKSTINATLVEIGNQVAKAEEAVEKGLSAKDQFLSETNDKLAKLRERWDGAEKKVSGLKDAAKSKATVALESAEEAIQEANSSLGRYKSAAKEDARKIRSNIENLLSKAGQELDKIDEMGS